MIVTFIDKFSTSKVVTMDHIPDIGHQVRWNYIPYPIVKQILWDIENYNASNPGVTIIIE